METQKLLKRTWAEIDLDALAHNVRTLTRNLPEGCRFLGVVKADAYGHGAVPVAKAGQALAHRVCAPRSGTAGSRRRVTESVPKKISTPQCCKNDKKAA